MARARDPNRDKAKQMYLDSEGKMLLKDIAAKLGKVDALIRKWKKQDAWDDELNSYVTNDSNGYVTNESVHQNSQQSAVSSQKNERKRSGNPNPSNKFTKRNSAAVTHGFYAKYLPEPLKEIVEDAKDLTIVDRLYFQIETKFAALVQLHKIMFVGSKDDTLDERASWSSGEGGSGESYKIAYAYEQYAEYVKTEARLTAEWRNVVKQFLELASEDDERRLKLEQMQLNIAKTKAEIDKLEKDDNKDQPMQIQIVRAKKKE